MKRAVLLNDTSKYHLGCNLVVQNIVSLLAARNIEVISRARSKKARSAYESVVGADLVVINGEGSIHHNTKSGTRLLGVVDVAAAHNVPVVLVNTTYQANDASLTAKLKNVKLVAVRESLSQRELAEQGIASTVCGDLSMFNASPHAGYPKNSRTIGVTDSIFHRTTLELLEFLKHNPDATYESIFRKSLKVKGSPRFEYWQRVKILRRLFWSKDKHRCHFYETAADYERAIAGLRLLITGRFHSACIAIKNYTPFLITKSNSFKVEGLLADLGMSGRMVTTADLTPDLIERQAAYSPAEVAKIDAYLAAQRASAVRIFDEIAGLAR